MLLGNTGGQQIKAARRDTIGLGQGVNDAQAAANAQAQTAQGQAQTFADQVRQKIQGARDPVSTALDARVKEFQDVENQRLTRSKQIEDILKTVGRDPNAGVANGQVQTQDLRTDNDLAIEALNAAAQHGYISQEDLNKVASLMPRAQALGQGFGIKKLLQDHMVQKNASGLDRINLAGDSERAQLGALSRLAGTDDEFAAQRSGSHLGQTRFNVGKIEQLIANEEARRKGQEVPFPQASAPEAPQMDPMLWLTPAGMPLASAATAFNVADKSLNSHAESLKEIGNAASNGDVLATTGAIANTPSSIVQGTNEGLRQGIDYSLNSVSPGLAGHVGDMATMPTDIAAKQAQDLVARQRQVLEDIKKGRVDQAAINQALLGVRSAGSLANDVGRGIRDVAGNLTQVGRDIANGVRNADGTIRNVARGVANIGRRIFSDKNLKTNVKDGGEDVYNFLDNMKGYTYDYKDEKHGDADSTSVMAQDLEKSKIGKKAVIETPEGKMVDYDKLFPAIVAAQAEIHHRIKKLEKK
jgi:uncharacterized protein YoxC